jgi:CTP synthase
MTLTLVSHSPCSPALYGALAAVVAQADDALLLHLPADFGPAHGADSVQMVAAAGALVPSGLIWYERLTAREVLPASNIEQIIEAATQTDVVVPWHDEFQSISLRDALLSHARTAGLAVCHLTGKNHGDSWVLEDMNGQPTAHGNWCRDTLGRWNNGEHSRPDAAARSTLSIALLGTEDDQTNVYPATLAALGDASEALNIDLHIRFINPMHDDVAKLDCVAGIVLPGGSDMANVPGQIRAAHYGLAADIPTLGLCLGMQSMTTALAQTLPGLERANMAEAAPDAAILSFLPMAEIADLPVHRLGNQRLRFTHPKWEGRFEKHPTIRCNHRYRLNPELIDALMAAGLAITATDVSGHIVDAIDWSDHVFYRGMQGHPELGSRAGAAHPMIEDFLLAAQSSAATTLHSNKRFASPLASQQ